MSQEEARSLQRAWQRIKAQHSSKISNNVQEVEMADIKEGVAIQVTRKPSIQRRLAMIAAVLLILGIVGSTAYILHFANQQQANIAARPSPTLVPNPNLVPNILHFTRTAGMNNAPVLKRTVTDATAVQNLYTAANALTKPTETSYMVNCPMMDDVTYKLEFFHDQTPVKEIDFVPLSWPCGGVEIGNDQRIWSDQFGQLIAQTVNIPYPLPSNGPSVIQQDQNP